MMQIERVCWFYESSKHKTEPDMTAQAKAAGLVKDFREHHYLRRADIHVLEAWHNALLLLC